MTWLVKTVFWMALGVMSFSAATAAYLLVALRQIELLPALAGAGIVPAALTAAFAYRSLRKNAGKATRSTMESITIGQPAVEVIEIV